MCIALPARLLDIAADGTARADVDGRTRTIVLTALASAVAPGDWVLVHAGLAVEVLDERQAAELTELLREARNA